MSTTDHSPDPDDTEGKQTDGDVTKEELEAAERNRQRREKLLAVLRGPKALSDGNTGHMAIALPAVHQVLLEGPKLTDRGGPASVVMELVSDVVNALISVAPHADPWIHALMPTMSMEIQLEPSEDERRDAAARVKVLDDSDFAAVTDTGLGLSVLTRVLGSPEPDRAAAKTFGLSARAVSGVQKLGDGLLKHGIDVVTFDQAVQVQRASVERLMEELDRETELPNETVPVTGVLKGVDSDSGRFVFVTDERIPLPVILSYRRNPGAKLRGLLPDSTQQKIKRENLWDRHVEAQVEVVRSQRGSRQPTIEGLRLVGITARFADAKADAEHERAAERDLS